MDTADWRGLSAYLDRGADTAKRLHDRIKREHAEGNMSASSLSHSESFVIRNREWARIVREHVEATPAPAGAPTPENPP